MLDNQDIQRMPNGCGSFIGCFSDARLRMVTEGNIQPFVG